MILTYRYRLKDRHARKRLAAFARSVNQVWNWCVSQQRDTEERYRAGAKSRRWASSFTLAANCKGVGRELGIHQQTVQNVCEQFVASRTQRKRAPRFRASAGPKRALGWVPFQKQSRKLDGNKISYLDAQFRWFGSARRPLPPTVKGGEFVEDAQGRWWVCFRVEVADAMTIPSGEVGIDLGLKTLATLSDGGKIDATQPYRNFSNILAIAQRSRNRRRIRAIHTKIANVRKDHLHKATCRIARENGLIAVGNVSSSRLAKTRMAKSVLDAGWGMFRWQLRYKASRHGAVYLDIDERFTTQMCSCCGVIPDSSPKGMGALGMRDWKCSNCGASHDRDVNAAQNILNLGRSAAPRVDESRGVG